VLLPLAVSPLLAFGAVPPLPHTYSSSCHSRRFAIAAGESRLLLNRSDVELSSFCRIDVLALRSAISKAVKALASELPFFLSRSHAGLFGGGLDGNRRIETPKYSLQSPDLPSLQGVDHYVSLWSHHASRLLTVNICLYTAENIPRIKALPMGFPDHSSPTCM